MCVTCMCGFMSASCACVSAGVHGCGDRAEVDITLPSSLCKTAHLCSARSHLRERQGLYLGMATDFIVHLVEVTVAKTNVNTWYHAVSTVSLGHHENYSQTLNWAPVGDSHCARSYGRQSQRKTGQASPASPQCLPGAIHKWTERDNTNSREKNRWSLNWLVTHNGFQ